MAAVSSLPKKAYSGKRKKHAKSRQFILQQTARMTRRFIMSWQVSIFLLISLLGAASCKKTSSNRNYEVPLSEKELFGSKSLRCLVCKAVVEEFEYAISQVDPKKKIDIGTARLSSEGKRESKVITYARSEIHLTELIDTVCKQFEEYAQAKERSTGEATIIRLMARTGGMNPRFGEVEIIPDDDLNTRLKFYCEGIVEDQESDLMELFAEETKGVARELCHTRTSICDERSIGRDEL